MDSKTRILVGLGAATAANCIPCFKNYYEKARKDGISDEEVLEAVELGLQMKGGAHMDMRKSIQDTMAGIRAEGAPCCRPDGTSTCGC